MFEIGSPISRLTALALVALAPASIYVAIVGPALDYYQETQREIDQSRALVQRYDRIARQLPQMKAAFAELRKVNPQRGDYLRAHERPLAVAELQGQVRQVIAAGRGQLVGSQVIGSLSETPRETVAIRIDMKVEPKGLLHVLHRVETARPFMILNNLTVRPDTAPRLRATPKRPERQLLAVQFDVQSYLWGDEK